MNLPSKTEKSGNSNQEWTVGWGFTGLCDLACDFCYSAGVESFLAKFSNEDISCGRSQNEGIDNIPFCCKAYISG